MLHLANSDCMLHMVPKGPIQDLLVVQKGSHRMGMNLQGVFHASSKPSRRGSGVTDE
jgi:hypothetical protein